jgi:hypothetical protein
MSDIEGKVAREAMSECGQRVNGAAGTRATWMGKTERSNAREHMSQFQHFGAVALSVCADLKSARKIGWSANARIANREIS